ncbi:MAG: hypothetical protein SOV16_07635 [Anaerobiospirillum succiniciproducens]|uniref:hypothetical protein n=1 Tax=Anaerobiospirillum succiniciproducens TaxID=13335 RepID=UPI00235745C4|nr:hypothetical protein [Anaerobiospirillum succiniciproducens]MCI6864050.1 DUF2076 domain-containing protein [Anaerobiospirillum succiniciproducens]MDY2799015.1 hypothetical protein [Anaerobiospirillum succiniciproducens]
MFKKTLITSAVTAVFALTSQGVQANPITDLVSGFVKDAATVQFDARRGGSRSFSRSSAPKRSVSSTRTAQKRPVADTKAPAQNNAATAQRPGQQNTPNAPQAAPTGGMGMGGSFISSLAGAGAGVLLANMLLSPTAAASQGTEVATPDMLSDTQIDECLAQIKLDIEDAKARLAEAAPEDQNAIRDELSKMNELQITLLNEQINRIQKG